MKALMKALTIDEGLDEEIIKQRSSLMKMVDLTLCKEDLNAVHLNFCSIAS